MTSANRKNLEINRTGIYYDVGYYNAQQGTKVVSTTTDYWLFDGTGMRVSGPIICTQMRGKVYSNQGEYRMPVVSSASSNAACSGIGTTSTGLTVSGQYGSSSYSSKTYAASSSDMRLKENIKDSTIHALDIIKQIRHREFDWKDGTGHYDVGYIAQELEEIDERLVMKPFDENGVYGVQTFYLQGVMSKAMQEQQEIIEELQSQVKQLENELKDLKENRL